MLERLQRVMLAFLPREFRDEFGEDVLATARALDAERPRRLRRRVRAMADALVTPFTVRADLRREHRRAFIRRTVPMESLMRDLRFAVRGLVRAPSFTAFCCLTLALGIGANAAMFGIADRLLLGGPEHITDAGRVVRLYATTTPAGMRSFTTSGFGYVTYDAMRHGTSSFIGFGTYAVNSMVFGSGSDATRANVGSATADLFPLLGVKPLRGRFFTEAEDAVAGAAHVAVISEPAWRSWFGASDDALGRSIILNDEPFTVIGIAPHGFTGPQFDRVDAWVPGALYGSRVTANWTTTWNAQWLHVVGRLNPGVTIEQAAQDATAAYRRAYTGGDAAEQETRMSVASLRANDSGVESTDLRVLRWLAAVSALVLLVACANIANLLLARGVRRGREVAIRAALGAARLRLVRLLLLEALLLSFIGALVGLFVAYEVGVTARNLLFTTVEWTSPPVNLRVFLVSTGIALATGLLIGLVPAIRSTRPNLTDSLKTGAREGGGHRSRLRSALTIAQAAFSVVLLVGAGLFVQSLWRAYTLDFGFDPDHVTVIEISRRSLNVFPEGSARDAERARRRSFYLDVLDRVKAVPGVEHASVATGMPFGNRFSTQLRASDVLELPKTPGGQPGVSAVTSDYFDTMGTPVRRGRMFTKGEGAGSEPVTIVSQLMADTLWPGQDPLGKCLYIGNGAPGPPPVPPPCSRIVGIAGNTYRSRLREDPVMHYYIPEGQEVGFGGAVLLIRSQDTSGAATDAVRRFVTSLDSTINYVRAETIRSRIDPQVRPWVLGASVFAASGLLALIVAGIGIYSVMSYGIADRRHEIGVRLALGARTVDIIRLVFGGSVTMAVVGVVIGEAIAWSLGGIAAPLLFATSPHDLAVFLSVGGVLVGVAILATIGPSRLAGRISALEALRAE